MEGSDNKKQYDLLRRTRSFAKNTRSFLKKLNTTIANVEDSKQLVRSSGSVAANYIEANDAFSKKDFFYRIKICRKEAKESILFLSLIDTDNDTSLDNDKLGLIREGTELMKIFGSIVTRSNL